MKNRSHAQSGMSLLDTIVAVAIFSVAAVGTTQLVKGTRDFHRETSASSQQNSYATFRAQLALQGIDPTKAANVLERGVVSVGDAGTTAPLANNDLRTAMSLVRGKLATFEVGASSRPTAAGRTLAGSAAIQAYNYRSDAAGPQRGKGVGMGFGIQVNGTAAAPTAIQLASPTFNYSGDISSASFPLNNIVSYPGTNPAGTIYRYTTDGSTPTTASPIWNNSPGWTLITFPASVTVRAFNTDPQYLPSNAISAAFRVTAGLTFVRADGRASNLYGFTLAELGTPNTAGIVLTTSAPAATIYYTLDGSMPSVSSPIYTGPFAPAQSMFAPNVVLRALIVSSDSRFTSPPATTFPALTPNAVPLPNPTFVTDNSAPIAAGTSVVIAYSNSYGTPRTAVNTAPSAASSAAMSFPLY